jgi:hypothetical protein
MSEELTHVAPILVEPAEAVEAANQQVPGPPHPMTPPSEEQRQAAEAVFAAEEREHNTVAGLLGLWTGTMLLNDLAQEHFSRPTDEELEEEERKRRKRGEPE